MPHLYANPNYDTNARALWHAVEQGAPQNVYYDHRYVVAFTTAQDPVHPEYYKEMQVPDILKCLDFDRGQPEIYSTEDKVAALNALEHIEEGLPKKYENLAGRIRLFVSALIHYFRENVWLDELAVQGCLLKIAITDLAHEIEVDVRNAYRKINADEHTIASAVPAALAAKRARTAFKRASQAKKAAVKIQSVMRGHLARKAYRTMQIKAAEDKAALVKIESAPAPLPPIPPAPKIEEKPLPVLTFADEAIEVEPRQFYVFDKNNPKEVAERNLRIAGETVGTAGRIVRQLFRSLANRVNIASLKEVSGEYRVYCLTLKHAIVGTVPGTKDKITLPATIRFEIQGEGEHRVIHFLQGTDLPDIIIDGDRIKAKVGLFKKIDVSFQEGLNLSQ